MAGLFFSILVSIFLFHFSCVSSSPKSSPGLPDTVSQNGLILVTADSEDDGEGGEGDATPPNSPPDTDPHHEHHHHHHSHGHHGHHGHHWMQNHWSLIQDHMASLILGNFVLYTISFLLIKRGKAMWVAGKMERLSLTQGSPVV